MTTTGAGVDEADFSYGAPERGGGVQLAASVFADRAALRDEIRADALAAGLQVRECGSLEALHETEKLLGDVLLLDCPEPSGGDLAALASLDDRAARTGLHLIVSTRVEALEDVFGACDQSGPQILVNSNRAERMIALGRARAVTGANHRVRELSQEDRLTLLRLTEQVDQIAERLDRIGDDSQPVTPAAGAFTFAGPADNDREPQTRKSRPALPDPRLLRRIIKLRKLRGKFFDERLFADPAWDMLLDLAAARAEHTRVSVTSLCIASGVPPTTALRWIGQMTESGLLERVQDDADRRRAFIALTDKAAEGMAHCFAEFEDIAAQVV